ncbi:MAG: sulfite exporter TauE/SafE family protein [Acetobacteraceae bacterium]
MISTLLIVLFGVFAASVLRGFTGFGFGLAAVPLLSLALPPAEVVPFVVVLQVAVGLGGLRAAWRHCDWRAVGGLVPGLVMGIPVGLAILTSLSPNVVRLAIGLVIAASVVLLARGASLPHRPSIALSGAVGLISGVISGLASMGGPPIVVYLLALGHSAVIVRATSIVFFMLSGMMSMASMSIAGLIDREVLIWAGLSVPVLFAGSWLGTWGFHQAKPHHHRATALAVLSVLAVVLILRALAT